MNKDSRQRMFSFLMGLLLVAMAISILRGTSSDRPVTLSSGEMMSAATAGKIRKMSYDPQTGEVSGMLGAAAASVPASAPASSTTSSFNGHLAGSDAYAALVAAAGKGYPALAWDTAPLSAPLWVSLLGALLPVLLIGALLIFFMRKMSPGGSGGGGMAGFGKSKAKRPDVKAPRTTFKDVAGADEAVQELAEIRDFLSEPQKFKALGAKIPTGVLLVGPPGTGKTLLAKAVAGEAGVPFFTVSGSDFVEMFVGVGSARVRSMFEDAKKAAPAIVFIDEIDAVGRQRGAGVGGGNDEREQTLNSILVEMDGFHGNETVIVIAATNRPDVLDPALLRPGRFDRQITVDRPDLVGREAILRIHAAGKPLDESVDLHDIARTTAGMAGADLANLMNEGALLAARHGHRAVTSSDLEEAFERVIAGSSRKGRVINDKERRIIAYHEAGHAIVGHELEETDPIHKVTILPRGRSLGSTWALPEEDTFLESEAELRSDIAMLLGGRTAEEVACGGITTGAGNDIERASVLARAMVTKFGMSPLGPLTFGKPQADVFLGRDLGNAPDYGPGLAADIDAAVSTIIEEAHATARRVLERRRATLDLMASVLLERETIDGDVLAALLGDDWEAYLVKEAAQAKRDELAGKMAEEMHKGATGKPRKPKPYLPAAPGTV